MKYLRNKDKSTKYTEISKAPFQSSTSQIASSLKRMKLNPSSQTASLESSSNSQTTSSEPVVETISNYDDYTIQQAALRLGQSPLPLPCSTNSNSNSNSNFDSNPAPKKLNLLLGRIDIEIEDPDNPASYLGPYSKKTR